jgi:hypothetical protein
MDATGYYEVAERSHSGVGEKGGARLLGRAAVAALSENHQPLKLQ